MGWVETENRGLKRKGKFVTNIPACMIKYILQIFQRVLKKWLKVNFCFIWTEMDVGNVYISYSCKSKKKVMSLWLTPITGLKWCSYTDATKLFYMCIYVHVCPHTEFVCELLSLLFGSSWASIFNFWSKNIYSVTLSTHTHTHRLTYQLSNSND